MRILVIGLDGAAPEILFGDENLVNFHRVAEFGCYGELESTHPLTADQAWLSVATGQDPGSARGYEETAIWDPIIRQGKRAVVTGWLPFELSGGNALVVHRFDGEVMDDDDLRTADKAQLKDQVYSASRKQFEKVQHLLQTEDWGYFQFIETGLGRIQRAFWPEPDMDRSLSKLENPDHALVQDYYRQLDSELETILETLTGDTMVLVISIQGARFEEHNALDNGSNSIRLGFFILAAPNNPLDGEIEVTRLIDIAPTLLKLGGYEIPGSMQGKSLLSDWALESSTETGLTADEEEILRERLSGLGYIS
jgi:arylsulfatase A-like enzyme